MSLDKLTNALVLILLIEMMVATGLGVSLSDLRSVIRNGGLLVRTLLANYIVVPSVAIALLYLFKAMPLVSVGFLLIAVCPGAPFAPPLVRMAKGNVPVSVGLMLLLAATSAILAPLLLTVLMPLVARGAGVQIDTVKIVTTLLMSQLLPLSVGLLIRTKRPQIAEKLQKPASLLTAILSVAVFGLIIAVQFRTLTELRWKSASGICALLLLCLAAGWILGGPTTDIRRAVSLTTAARNLGVGLVIATASFPDSVAVTAVILFAIFQTIGLVLIALWMGRRSVSSAQ